MAYSPSGYAYDMPSPDISGQGGGMDWLTAAIYASTAILGGIFGGGSEQVPKDYNEWLKMQDKQFDVWKSKMDYNLSEGYRNWARMQEHELEQWQWKRQTQMADLYGSPLKPKTPYYGIERNLPAYDYMLSKTIVGNLGEKFGEERLQDYGLDLDKMRGALRVNQPYKQFYQGWKKGLPKYQYPQPGAFMPSEKQHQAKIQPIDPFEGVDWDAEYAESERLRKLKNGEGKNGEEENGGMETQEITENSSYANWAKGILDKILKKYRITVDGE